MRDARLDAGLHGADRLGGRDRERLSRLEPVLDALRIRDPRVLAERVEQHDHERFARDVHEHDHALAGLADVAGLLQRDVPRLVLDERVGIVESERPAGRLQLHEVRRRRRELADQRIFGRSLHELREIARRRDVLRREPGRIGIMRMRHAERERLEVHRRDERLRAARVMARERRGGAVLGRHQREAQHLAARQRRSHPQPRVAALQVIEIGCVDVDFLVERLLRVEHDHRRHQLRDRGDRRHLVCRFCVDLPIRGSVEDKDVGGGEAQPCRIEIRGLPPRRGGGNNARKNNR